MSIDPRKGTIPKHGYLKPPEIHSGMHFRDRSGFLLPFSHQQVVNAPDASGKRPLDPTVPGKKFTPPAVTPSMRHRSADSHGGSHPGENLLTASRSIDHALGQKILDEAYGAGSAHDRMARHVPLAPKFQPK